jgi:hypothetical protein
MLSLRSRALEHSPTTPLVYGEITVYDAALFGAVDIGAEN